MIVFVDLRGQCPGFRFAFWNTVPDKFVELANDHAWESWEDLLGAIQLDNSDLDKPYVEKRLRALCPEWVFQEKNSR